MAEVTRQMNDWAHKNPGEGAGLMVDAVCEITRLRRELDQARMYLEKITTVTHNHLKMTAHERDRIADLCGYITEKVIPADNKGDG